MSGHHKMSLFMAIDDSDNNSVENDNFSVPPAPSSPTNVLHSPVSTRLWGKQISKNHMFRKSNHNVRKYSLSKHVIPHPLPIDWRDKIILGSSSESRRNVMDALGWEFRQMSPDIDEKAIRCDNPLEMPLLIAKAKADAIIKKLEDESFTGEALIITADQIVVYKDVVREKPESREQAIEYLSSYSNSQVSTVSAVVCTYYPMKRQASEVDVATVHWNAISKDVVERVVEKGEVYSSAGGFRIEDDDLNPLIKMLDGTVDSVFGLPVDLMIELMNIVFRGEEHHDE